MAGSGAWNYGASRPALTGTNDIEMWRFHKNSSFPIADGVNKTLRSFADFVSYTRTKLPNAHFMVGTLLPAQSGPRIEWVTAYNTVLLHDATCTNTIWIPCVDLGEVMPDILSDAYHPGPRGEAVLAGVWFRSMRRTLSTKYACLQGQPNMAQGPLATAQLPEPTQSPPFASSPPPLPSATAQPTSPLPRSGYSSGMNFRGHVMCTK